MEDKGSTQKIATICCACETHISGPHYQPGKPVSHGYCKPCETEALIQLEIDAVSVLTDASIAP